MNHFVLFRLTSVYLYFHHLMVFDIISSSIGMSIKLVPRVSADKTRNE